MNLEEKVIAVIRENLEEKSAISTSTRLRTELHLDSFGTLMVINALEEAFSISIKEEDFHGASTVADVIALLRSKYQCQ